MKTEYQATDIQKIKRYMKRTLITLFACFALSTGFSQNSNNPCPGVTPNYSHVIEAAAGGIRFTNTTVTNTNENYSYSWEFGNGSTSNEKDPFVPFEEGVYQVTMTVIGTNGCQSAITKDVEFSYNGQ